MLLATWERSREKLGGSRKGGCPRLVGWWRRRLCSSLVATLLDSFVVGKFVRWPGRALWRTNEGRKETQTMAMLPPRIWIAKLNRWSENQDLHMHVEEVGHFASARSAGVAAALVCFNENTQVNNGEDYAQRWFPWLQQARTLDWEHDGEDFIRKLKNFIRAGVVECTWVESVRELLPEQVRGDGDDETRSLLTAMEAASPPLRAFLAFLPAQQSRARTPAASFLAADGDRVVQKRILTMLV